MLANVTIRKYFTVMIAAYAGKHCSWEIYLSVCITCFTCLFLSTFIVGGVFNCNNLDALFNNIIYAYTV